MDDLFKYMALGFFGFVVLHGSLEQHGRHSAERQVRQAFHHTGQVRAQIIPRGLFGLFANDITSVTLQAKGIETDSLPFSISPRSGWKGHIKLLRLRFTEFRLMGLPVERFDADIPDATYDLGHAFWKDRLQLRSAGIGPPFVSIRSAGLEAFLSKKYNQILSDVKVLVTQKQISITGQLKILGSFSPFSASGGLIARDGRYVAILNPFFEINGGHVSDATTALLLKQFNPILDIEKDLGLGTFFTLRNVEVGEGVVTIQGSITLPRAETQLPPAPERK